MANVGKRNHIYMKENYIYYEDLGFGYSIWTNIGTRTDISGSAGYDVAYKMMGEDWRMPTKKECEELVNNCTWEWTKVNGNNGYKVIGPNGANSTFKCNRIIGLR